MSWWQVAMVSVASIWVGVSWVEDVVEKIVARRLEAHLIRLEVMLVERRFISSDPPHGPTILTTTRSPPRAGFFSSSRKISKQGVDKLGTHGV